MALRWVPIMLALALFGCAKSPAAEPSNGPDSPQESSPDVYEQTRSGAFQIGTVLETLEEAMTDIRAGKKAAKGDDAHYWASAEEALDSAGEGLDEYSELTATREEFHADFAKWDDWRHAAIDAGSDAVHDLGDAAEALDGVKGAEGTLQLLGTATADLKEAVETMGGKIEQEEVPSGNHSP